uniref:G-protein coupled receptors family 1 profile domain-containing protein n=1 Tax=Marmota marmota marmota TaxID=9994 RepID=A0A8C5ZMZ2_MARMA
MDTPGYPSLVPTTSDPGNSSSSWLLDVTPGNASSGASPAGLAVSGVLIPLVYLVVCVVGLLGNSLVIYVVLRHTASPSVTSVYILNLALADELFMLGLPFLAAQNALSYWPFGSFMCRLVMAVDGINQFTSIFCLTVMSVDRYLAVVHPARSARWRTAPVARTVSAAAWATSLQMSIPRPQVPFLPIFQLANLIEESRLAPTLAGRGGEGLVSAVRGRVGARDISGERVLGLPCGRPAWSERGGLREPGHRVGARPPCRVPPLAP